MTEKEKKDTVNNQKDEIKKLREEELDGVTGGVVDGDLIQDDEMDSGWN